MADGDITNAMLLEHIQAMKIDLQNQITNLDRKIDGKIASLTDAMNRGFEEARQHRQALQEDLEATIRMLGKHEEKLARL